ncbi:hypothetical protein D3C76_1101880 [compost metagenome]
MEYKNADRVQQQASLLFKGTAGSRRFLYQRSILLGGGVYLPHCHIDLANTIALLFAGLRYLIDQLLHA